MKNNEEDFFKKKDKGRLIILKNKETYSKPNNNKASNKTEIIFKKVSSLKSINNIKTLCNYLKNNGEYEIFDLLGKVEDLDDKFEYLDLVKDEDNLKSKYKNKVSRIEEKHLFKNQGYHFIISYPNNQSVSENKIMQATTVFLERQYAKGYDGFFTLHKHQKNLHAHIFMTAKNRITLKNIEMKKANLFELRLDAYECSKEAGLDVTCTKREFRQDLINDIKKGKEPLRKNYKEKKIQTELAKKVPTFAFKNHAFLVALKDKNEPLMKKFYQKIDLYEQLEGYQQKRLDEYFTKYKDPDMAKNLYLEMLCENRKTANWYLTNKPNIFSPLKEQHKKEEIIPSFYIISNDIKRLKATKESETSKLNLSKFNAEVSQLVLYQKIKAQERINDYLDKVNGITNEDKTEKFETGKESSLLTKLINLFNNKSINKEDKTTKNEVFSETKIDALLSQSIKKQKPKENNENER